MKPLLFGLGVVVGIGFQADLGAQGKSSAERAVAAVAVQQEDDVIAAAHTAARQDKDADVDVNLVAAPHVSLRAPNSVIVSRRAAAVCVWLLYEREADRATKLARRIVRTLETMPVESGTIDRFERLYWEAWLRAEILGDRPAALKLIGEAELLRPDDPRVEWSKKGWGAKS